MQGRAPGVLARVAILVALGGALAFPSFAGRSAPAAARAPRPPLPDVALAPDAPGARIDAQLRARLPTLEEPLRRLLGHTIVVEAAAARIDPLLVLALIEVESGWDPAARSPGGARGLMQLREATMRRELERAGLAPGDPDDPVENVRAGVRYLRRLLAAFGREELALMAYNAGPNRILGYLREGEIPERFHAYPRRIGAELRRLRRTLGAERGPELAQSRVVAEPQ